MHTLNLLKQNSFHSSNNYQAFRTGPKLRASVITVNKANQARSMSSRSLHSQFNFNTREKYRRNLNLK